MKRNAENPNLVERMERLERQTTLLLLTVVVQTAILFIQYRRIGFALDSLSQLHIYTEQLMVGLGKLRITLNDLLIGLKDLLGCLL